MSRSNPPEPPAHNYRSTSTVSPIVDDLDNAIDLFIEELSTPNSMPPTSNSSNPQWSSGSVNGGYFSDGLNPPSYASGSIEHNANPVYNSQYPPEPYGNQQQPYYPYTHPSGYPPYPPQHNNFSNQYGTTLQSSWQPESQPSYDSYYPPRTHMPEPSLISPNEQPVSISPPITDMPIYPPPHYLESTVDQNPPRTRSLEGQKGSLVRRSVISSSSSVRRRTQPGTMEEDVSSSVPIAETTTVSPIPIHIRSRSLEVGSPESPVFTPQLSMPPLSVSDDSFDPALLSNLSVLFKRKIKGLQHVRELFCAFEYPESFTGREAVATLKALIPNVDDKLALKVAKALYHGTPPLFTAIPYSEASLAKNTVIDSPDEVYTFDEDADETDVPRGVYTPLLHCYVRDCEPGGGGCYAPKCPNRVISNEIEGPGLQRAHSVGSMTSSMESGLSQVRAWSANVPKEVLESVSKDEQKRQEAIYELIYTEEDYVKDLDLLDELFAKPLRTAACIEASRREAFWNDVFYNYQDVRKVNKDLLKDIKERQQEAHIVSHIGDVFIKHVKNFHSVYTKYGPHFILSQYIVKTEEAKNLIFANFIKDREKQAEARRLPFKHFLIFPITRLQRYHLLLEAVLKKTPEGNPDIQDISAVDSILKEIASTMNVLSGEYEKKLRLNQIHEKLSFKPGETHDLRLLDENRKLIYEGDLKRRSELGVETLELKVFLFDHMLLMTKPRKANGQDLEYRVSKRPIPLDMLRLFSDSAGPTSASSTATTGFPFTITHLGRRGGTFTLFASSLPEKTTWKEKIIETKEARDKERSELEVFEVRTLSNSTFPGGVGSSTANATQSNRVTCTVPFTRADNVRMVAIGTDQGIWMGIEGDATTFKQVLPIAHVTQIAVLEQEHIFCLLADKVLTVYALDALCPAPNSRQYDRNPQRLATHVNYFHVGTCNNKSLVVSMRKRGLETHFKAHEPICGDLRVTAVASAKKGFGGLMSASHKDWFKVYKEFYVGAESTALHFLKTKIVVVCSKGFEIVDPEHLNMNRGIPDLRDPRFNFVVRRGENIKPLAMFRVTDRFLLCYDECAFFVDNHGFLSKPSNLIEWEGTPDFIAFYPPYIIAFEPQFIEVRHVETGQMVQVIPGDSMRCTYFSNGHGRIVIHGAMSDPTKDFQHVFQLVVNHNQPH